MIYQLNYIYLLHIIDAAPEPTIKTIMAEFAKLLPVLQTELGVWKQRDLYRVLRRLIAEGFLNSDRPKRKSPICFYQCTAKANA